VDDEELQRLRDLARSGKQAAEIGKALGRAEQAVRNQFHKLGMISKRINLGLKSQGK
jgi:hypothetical protein